MNSVRMYIHRQRERVCNTVSMQTNFRVWDAVYHRLLIEVERVTLAFDLAFFGSLL